MSPCCRGKVNTSLDLLHRSHWLPLCHFYAHCVAKKLKKKKKKKATGELQTLGEVLIGNHYFEAFPSVSCFTWGLITVGKPYQVYAKVSATVRRDILISVPQ